ncbi:MAG: acetyltransferase, partial [Fimbriimonadaceae bacterium]|nr:acetyltransferase [Chitinophagales bacterium]
GMGRIARQYDFVVMYAGLRTNGRGHYTVRMKLITDNAKEMEPQRITELYMKELEEDILYDPVPYLWSHRRWKLTERLKNNEPMYR